MQAQDWATFERLRRQAQFLLQARRYKETIDLALKAIALFPEDPRPYALVAYAMARQKRPEAPEWALKAIARQPENVLWRTALSDTYTLRGKWKQALKPMSEAVAMDPTNPRLQSMLGLILLHRRRPKEALPYLERSLELDPTNALTHQRMSIALSKLLGKNKRAEEHLRKALELQPDNPAIKNTLGWRLLGRGHREEAETVFYEALRVDPTQAASKLGLGAPAGIKKGPSDIILRGALRLYSIPYRIILAPASAVMAIEIPWLILTLGGSWLFKGVSLTLATWGWCYILSLVYVRVIGKRREEVSSLSKTLDMLRNLAAQRPDDFDVRIELAELLTTEKQSEEALHVLDEAFSLRPDNLEALRLYGRVLYDLNRLAEARDKLETASRKGLPDAKSDMLLSHIYDKLGDQVRAYELYKLAVRRDRDLETPSYFETIRQRAPPIAISPGSLERGMDFEGEISRLTFKDVGGMDDVKEQFRINIILPLKNPTLFQTYGKRVGGGILLFGPPGCGKTYLSRALAGECNATFYGVGIHEILDKFLGESEKHMHSLFETARRNAPAVIFLDEIDLLGQKRTDDSWGRALRGATNVLLSELDEVGKPDKPILVIGATNTPWSVDTALRRPGRFDRIIFVPPPDQTAREEILKLHLREKPTEDIDYAKIASKLDQFSGADIRDLVDRAVELAIRRAMRSGKTEPITNLELLSISKEMRPSTIEWLATANDYVRYSNQSGLYDRVKEYIDKNC